MMFGRPASPGARVPWAAERPGTANITAAANPIHSGNPLIRRAFQAAMLAVMLTPLVPDAITRAHGTRAGAPRSRSAHMSGEERAGDVEHARPIDALLLGPAAHMLAYGHAERPRDLVQIGSVEEGVRQPVDEP